MTADDICTLNCPFELPSPHKIGDHPMTSTNQPPDWADRKAKELLPSFPVGFEVYPRIAAALREAYRRGVEEAAKAICQMCAKGMPFAEFSGGRVHAGSPPPAQDGTCKAWRIYALLSVLKD